MARVFVQDHEVLQRSSTAECVCPLLLPSFPKRFSLMGSVPPRHITSVAVLSDTDLAAAAQTLDMDRLHADHADFVWRSLQRLGARSADLPDLCQEVFLVVHRKANSFDGEHVPAWLFAICRRVAASQRRRAWSARIRYVDPPASYRVDPHAELDAREARKCIEALLDQMDPDRRTVFTMFEIEGLRCPEIAALLGVPLGTVYSRLRAARQQFAESVKRLKSMKDHRQ